MDLIKKMSWIGKYYILTYVLMVGAISCHVSAQEIKEIKYQDLEAIFASNESKVNVINFWATWCKPCIEEIPVFESITKEYGSTDVTVSLVSMDFVSELEGVKKFVAQKRLVSEVTLLNEPDYDTWINKVDQTWSGAIPATVIINTSTGEKKFFEKTMKQEELQAEIRKILNK
jgi:thiol-disulfide isomerase/thioredoxin